LGSNSANYININLLYGICERDSVFTTNGKNAFGLFPNLKPIMSNCTRASFFIEVGTIYEEIQMYNKLMMSLDTTPSHTLNESANLPNLSKNYD